MDDSEASEWVVVAEFPLLSTAEAARQRLDAAGIPCRIESDDTDPGLSGGVGRFQILVPRMQVEVAEHVLAPLFPTTSHSLNKTSDPHAAVDYVKGLSSTWTAGKIFKVLLPSLVLLILLAITSAVTTALVWYFIGLYFVLAIAMICKPELRPVGGVLLAIGLVLLLRSIGLILVLSYLVFRSLSQSSRHHRSSRRTEPG